MSQTSANERNAQGKPHVFRLHISDLRTGETKVALTLPIGLVGVAQRLGAQLLPGDQTIEALVAQAQQGKVERSWTDAEHSEQLDLILE